MKSFKELVFPVMYVYSDGRLIFLSDRTLSLSLFCLQGGGGAKSGVFSFVLFYRNVLLFIFIFFIFFITKVKVL